MLTWIRKIETTGPGLDIDYSESRTIQRGLTPALNSQAAF